jgi:hypothetical protein
MEERNMHQINTTGSCGLVLDTDRRSAFTGHFILNRYRVDDGGHICLTPSLPLSELRGSIEVLTAELESLIEQAEQRFPETTRAS